MAQRKEFLEKLKDFPCAFNLDLGGRIKYERLEDIRDKISKELEKEKDDIEEEKIRKKNLLIWALYCLKKVDDAVKLNTEVVEQTKSSNIPSLASRSFIIRRQGKEEESEKCLEQLQSLKTKDDFKTLHTQAVSEQAYYHIRMGGIYNLQKAIELYKCVIKENPTNPEWKFGLGQACRRATDPNVYCSFPKFVDLEELIQTAGGCLFDVGDNDNADDKTRGLAYVELVVMKGFYPQDKYNEIFRHNNIRELCDKALKYGSSSPLVLTHCGRSLTHVNIDRAIKLLEKSNKIRPHTTTYHHLGLSYEQKAGEKQAQIVDEVCSPYSRVNMAQRITGGEMTEPPPLDGKDLLVQNAIECYKKAADISYQQNLPASFDLGFIYKRIGQLKKAEEQFNKVTNSPFAIPGHRLVAINAYEEAGLALIELSQNGEKDMAQYEKGVKKLTQAIGLAADIASILPELKTCAQEVWKSFKTLKKFYDGNNKELLKLLRLVRDHGRIVEVVKDIIAKSDTELDDPGIITQGLESYLKLGQFENALAFLRLASTRPAALNKSVEEENNDMTDLTTKVLLFAVLERLNNKTDITKDLFQKVFELKYGNCYGGMIDETGEMNLKSEIVSDILILYDETKDTEKGYSRTSQIAHSLQVIFRSAFGLAASLNLQDCMEGGFQMELQLQECQKYELVVILVDDEEWDSLFTAILQAIPGNVKKNSQILVVNTVVETAGASEPTETAERNQGDMRETTKLAHQPKDDTGIPLVLKSCRHLNLQDIGWLSELKLSPRKRVPPSLYDIIQNIFGGDNKSLIKLFEFLVDYNLTYE